MYWIALWPSHEDERTAWGWRALQFTPRVAPVEEALLLEVSASERLWGGRKRLLRSLLHDCEPLTRPRWAQGATSLTALALLRLKLRGESPPTHLPQGLPLEVLSAAREHVPTLVRTGCRSWGDLRSLPRAGVARRFGAALLDALDAAYGEKPERYPWLQLPEEFDLKCELPALATTAPELMWSAQRLLTQMQVWLQARHRGVLALELEWTLDLRRLDGRPLPPSERLALRTSQPTQEIQHLRRLATEQLARTTLSAPANALRLRTLETVPWGGVTTSLLPEDSKPGEKLHQLVERLSVRLGEENVSLLQPVQDHRPECMQKRVPARTRPSRAGGNPGLAEGAPAAGPWTNQEALYPPWILREPLKLQVRADKPCYQGPLQLLTRARRLEAAWWDAREEAPVLRDYFIARSVSAGLLWIFRERLAADQDRARWFLHGLYA